MLCHVVPAGHLHLAALQHSKPGHCCTLLQDHLIIYTHTMWSPRHQSLSAQVRLHPSLSAVHTIMFLQVLMSCMSSFASIVVLLVLFWLVFSIMGLHVFGGLKLDEPWPNQDDLINALIMNFNVSGRRECRSKPLASCRRDTVCTVAAHRWGGVLSSAVEQRAACTVSSSSEAVAQSAGDSIPRQRQLLSMQSAARAALRFCLAADAQP